MDGIGASSFLKQARCDHVQKRIIQQRLFHKRVSSPESTKVLKHIPPGWVDNPHSEWEPGPYIIKTHSDSEFFTF